MGVIITNAMVKRKKKNNRRKSASRSKRRVSAKPSRAKVDIVGIFRHLFTKGVGLSIPLKVVLLTGTIYITSLITFTVITTLFNIDLDSMVAGIPVRIFWWGVQIFIVASTATLSTHFFLDRPLEDLRKVINRAEKGDFLVRAKVKNNDELGELAKNFNRMLSHITNLAASNIQTEQDLAYVQSELKLKTKLAEQAKVIKDTNQELKDLVRDLSLLYEVGQGVNATIELEELYQVITEVLQKRLKLSRFTILVKDEIGEHLHVKAAYGFSEDDHIFDMTFRFGEGITGKVAQGGEPVYLSDTTKEDTFLHYKGERIVDGSFLSIPLTFKKEVLGVINFHRSNINAFSKEEIRLLGLIANQIALAVENAKLYTKTRELSVRDELTGLYNRRHFQTVLQIEWKRAIRFHRNLSLLMIDVDHFKNYNDTFGHLQGDKVLRDMASLLVKSVRELDTIARFGGEEFIVLLPDTDKNGAIAVGEKLRKIIEAHRFADPNVSEIRSISISVGIASYPDDVREMDDLIDHADIALYDAKDSGRNRVVCYPQLNMPADLEAVNGGSKTKLVN